MVQFVVFPGSKINVSKHIHACYKYMRRWQKLSKIQIIAKHYSRCIIVDIENINAGIL